MADLTGQSIGRYHIIAPLGIGGMATVYKAYDTRLEREVAIKFIRTTAIPPDQLERLLIRFEREAKRMAKFTHPNIVQIIDYGEYGNTPYLVMPFLAGGTLKDKLKSLEGKPLSYQEAAHILAPIARALEYAHDQDTIHRDVKPANILLTDKGQPLLSDFGVAKILDSEEDTTLTPTGVGVGTPKYMAPEQWMNEISPQTDIYSLGVVFYELLTRHVPYDAETPAALMLKQNNDPLPRPRQFTPELPEVIEKILYTALAKKPNDRYVDMNAFATVLERVSYQDFNQSITADTFTINTPISDFEPAFIPQPHAPKPKPVAAAYPAEPQPQKPPVETRHKESQGIPKLWWRMGAAVLLLIVLVAGWTFMQRPAAVAEPTAMAPITAASVQNSIQPANTQPAQAASSITDVSSLSTDTAMTAESSPTVGILPSTTPIKEAAQEATETILPSPPPKGAPTPDKAFLKLPRFALKTPEDGTAFQTKGKMEFSWDSFPGAVSYRLEIIPAHSKNVIRFTTRETNKTQFSESLNWGGLFTWQVVALDQDEQPSAYSGQSYFSKQTLPGVWGRTRSDFTAGIKPAVCDGYFRNNICEKE